MQTESSSAFWGRIRDVWHRDIGIEVAQHEIEDIRQHIAKRFGIPGALRRVLPVGKKVFLGERGALLAQLIGIPGASSRHFGGT